MLVSFGFSKIVLAQEIVDPQKFNMEEFLKNMDREELEGLTLGLIADSLNVSTGEVLNNPEKGMVVVRRMESRANDELAKSTLQALSVAAEAFTTAPENQGKYPQKIEDLTEDKEPYLNQKYCGEMLFGFKYDCEFSAEGYKLVATPVTVGETGTAIFEITTGGVFEEKSL
jgi:hypothetical protein